VRGEARRVECATMFVRLRPLGLGIIAVLVNVKLS